MFTDEAFEERSFFSSLWGMPGVLIGVLSDVLKLIRSQGPRDEIEVLALSRM